MNNMSIDELEGEYFHFFNTDYLLLVIIILLEKYHHGQRDGFGVSSAFFLGDFIKGGISSLEDVVNEINDTSDYSSPNEYILSHIIRAEELNMLKVRQIGVQDLISIQYKVMNCAVKNDPRFPIEPDYYCMIIDELMEFKNLEKERNEKMVENGTFTSEEFRGPIFFSGEYTKHIRMLLDIAPENIYIRVTFIDEGIKRVEKELKQYISNFSEDLFKDRKPEYSETTRLYFSKQIESFYAYITNLSLVNSTINIPFSALESKDFEIVKILKYLELNKIITINKWDDEGFWKVDFTNTPITIESLVSKDSAKNKNVFGKAKFVNGTLHFHGKQLSFNKKQIQKDLLNTLFKKPGHVWSNDEIFEDWGEQDFQAKTMKFYTASDLINKAIALETGIRDFLIRGTKQAQINPKYVS